MVWEIIFVTVIGGLIGLGTFIIVRKNIAETKDIKVQRNLPIMDCTTRKKFTQGYTSLLVKTQRPNKNETTLIEGYPLDWNQEEGEPRPELQSFVVKNESLIRFARGELSNRREFIKILPRNKSELPEKMRETDEGKALSIEGQKKHIESVFGNVIPYGDEAIGEAMIKWSRAGISRIALSQMYEENQQYKKMLAQPPQPKDVSK